MMINTNGKNIWTKIKELSDLNKDDIQQNILQIQMVYQKVTENLIIKYVNTYIRQIQIQIAKAVHLNPS